MPGWIVMLLAGWLCGLAADAAKAGEWENALKPAGTPGKALPITRDGAAVYSIRIPAKATTEETKAADDLREWLRQISGAELSIAHDAAGPAIILSTDEKLPAEGYRIAIDGEDLHLFGGPGRGVINAVYALLEEDLGCRFYTNESIRLPRTASLSIAVVEREYSPKLIQRDPFYFASFDPVWSLRNRTNAPDAHVPEEFGGHVDYGGLFVHTHATLLPPAEYFSGHPDYFMLDAAGNRQSWQVCPTHPEVAKIVTDKVLAILTEHPETEIVSVSKNDNGGDQFCRCERCTRLRDAEGGTDMANQLVLVNHVAEAVEQKFPRVLVDTIAYLETLHAPKSIRPRQNVVIRICNTDPWSRPFVPARSSNIASVMKTWSAMHDRFSIWDYNVNFSHFLAPMPNMDVIADNIRFWVENDAVGVMTQGGYQSTSERDELRSWVIAKLMWDPSRDVGALVRDFTLGHYGKAGPAMMEYENLLAQARKDHAEELAAPPSGIRYPMTVGFLSKAFLAHADEIFTRAKTQAADDEVLVRRIERAELPILYVKLAQGTVTEELLNRFETIARREKVNWLLEWQVGLDQQLASWRAQIRK